MLAAIREGIALITWTQDGFAYADSFDEATGRYRALRAGQQVALADADDPGLLVRAEVAARQLKAERETQPVVPPVDGGHGSTHPVEPGVINPIAPPLPPPEPPRPKRFHGTVVLDTTRVGRDASVIAEEVIAHLSGLVGANVKVTLEVEAEIPAGAPDHVVRTVTENSRTLKFTNQGFEQE